MRKRRLFMDRSKLILSGWARVKSRGMYIVLFEARGAQDQSLASLLRETQGAFTQQTSGARWARLNERWRVGGKISSTQVVMTQDKRWLVRRWLTVGTTNKVAAKTLDADLLALSDQWHGCLGDQTVGRVALTRFLSNECDAAAQLITDCYSVLDKPAERTVELSARLLSPEEYTHVAELHARYYAPATLTELLAQMSSVERAIEHEKEDFEQTVRAGRVVFEYRIWDDRYRVIEIPNNCIPFMEYALAMKGQHSWNSYKAGSSTTWARLVDEARSVKGRQPAEIDWEHRPDRSGKK